MLSVIKLISFCQFFVALSAFILSVVMLRVGTLCVIILIVVILIVVMLSVVRPKIFNCLLSVSDI